jgi:hypothetical protein
MFGVHKVETKFGCSVSATKLSHRCHFPGRLDALHSNANARNFAFVVIIRFCAVRHALVFTKKPRNLFLQKNSQPIDFMYNMKNNEVQMSVDDSSRPKVLRCKMQGNRNNSIAAAMKVSIRDTCILVAVQATLSYWDHRLRDKECHIFQRPEQSYIVNSFSLQ